MIHTEIDLPADVYKNIERIAKASKRQPGQVMRDLIEQGLRIQDPTPKSGHRLDRLVALQFHGPKDLAGNIDRYLYDD
jgi:hypothetical protein